MNYDDRLDGHSDVESLADVAEDIAEEMAQEHFTECYDDGLCAACTEDTPISGEWGPWLGKKRSFDNLVQAVETAAGTIDPDGGPHFWINGELSGTYLDAFRAAANGPEDCVVCTHEIIEDDEECGHERYGEECPVTT